MLTILHAADLHLDSPFRSLPPRQAQERRQAQRQTLDALRDLALERQADLVLLAGDLFDSQEVYPETLEALERALGQLPCPVCIAPGNHDPYTPQSPYARRPWPDNVFIFQDEAVTALPFPALGVTVYGCAITSSAREDDPLTGFHAPADDTLPIGVFHADVGSVKSPYAPMARSSLAASGLCYAALGHIHTPELHLDEPTPWAYSGCIQGRGFDELGDRGCYLVSIAPDRSVTATFCPLPGPRYRALSLDVTGKDPAQAAGALLSDFREDYVRLTLTGQVSALDLSTLRPGLEGLCRALELRNETRPLLDPWARLEEDTLTGYFLRELSARLDAAAPEDRPLLEQALRYGLAALEGREEPT